LIRLKTVPWFRCRLEKKIRLRFINQNRRSSPEDSPTMLIYTRRSLPPIPLPLPRLPRASSGGEQLEGTIEPSDRSPRLGPFARGTASQSLFLLSGFLDLGDGAEGGREGGRAGGRMGRREEERMDAPSGLSLRQAVGICRLACISGDHRIGGNRCRCGGGSPIVRPRGACVHLL